MQGMQDRAMLDLVPRGTVNQTVKLGRTHSLMIERRQMQFGEPLMLAL